MQEKTEDTRLHAGRLIHMLSHQMKRQDITPVGGDGLTAMQQHVLKFILLETMHRELYQKDIEEDFQIRKSTATGILQLMEKNGFIFRETSVKDARLKRIVPTRKAEAMRAEILKNIQKTESRLVKGIEEKDVEICMRVLYQMFNNLAGDKQQENKERGGHNE